MKRLTILSLIIAFSASNLISAPASFAETYFYDNSVDYTTTTVPYIPISKDTSWFDYLNPQTEYEISTEAELLGLASLVNENQVDRWKPTRIENFEGVTFILKNDIELTGKWEPIGTGSASYFAGVFDGNGHTISNLDIENDSGSAGLFGYLVGEVKNLTVKGKIKSGGERCGAIAGQLNSTGKITECISDVTISAKSKTGGIVGYNDGGTVELCINNGKVYGTYKVGGIVGENWGGVIDSCGNRGEIHSSKRGVATYGTGGVAGRSVSAESEIVKSYNQGKIFSDTEATGGIVGYINASGATVRECYNNAEIRIKNVNKQNKKLAKSYAGGIAGIVGANGIIIKNCYNASPVMNADISGGIIGHYINENDAPADKFYIKNNYYLSHHFKSGIGSMDNEQDRKATKASMSISSGSLNGMASSLTASYKTDTGIYGNGGYPVLRWQEYMRDEEKTYIPNVSKDIQQTLDSYLVKNLGKSSYGQTMINIFAPANFTNDAIVLYNDAKDKENK